MQNTTIKILVADDHKLFRRGIVKLLEDYSNIYVISEAEDGRELIDEYFSVWPDIVLVDIAMPVMTGLEAVEKIKEKDPKVRALFISMFDNDEYVYKVLKCGGMGLINKGVLSGELIYAIKAVAAGNKYFLNKSDEDIEVIVKKYDVMNKKPELPDLNYLTSREKEVLKFIAEGLTSEEISEKLYVSKRTVDTYRSKIMFKIVGKYK